ncbi:MAG TPA: NADP-dependent isocitrate dehydrogenase [Gemmatimonadaceae bacterium]|nr:NADP-dependent isocitrate dehydrogenase [Gemmatimonadaceae bacterium]
MTAHTLSPDAAEPMLAPAPEFASGRDATPITVAYGDGIGPEIMAATLRVLGAAGARLDVRVIEVGEQVYRRGVTAGIDDSAWATIDETRVFLKAPITTPQGGGYKSLNVTTRKTLGLYANVRPCRAYAPYVATRHPNLDVVIIRENEEDTYGGIEHRQTAEVTQCLKLITRPGCERIARYAFEWARANGRRKVTCMTKDNIMKITDGLFHRVANEVAAEYPDLQYEHLIIDIGTARLADTPERFDVVLLPNLYGDIVSDVVAQIAGSVGLAGSANIGTECAMFEAIHGSAPDIAGQDVANPSGLLNAAVMMLRHIGQGDVAVVVENAVLRTIEDGIHTRDIYREGQSKQLVGTTAFADAVIARLGQAPTVLQAAREASEVSSVTTAAAPAQPARRPAKALVGVDIFLDWDESDRDPNVLAERLRGLLGDTMTLKMITNRGTKVWPEGHSATFRTDHWRCRFMPVGDEPMTHAKIANALTRLAYAGLDAIKTENLYTFDGVKGYSLGQGE